MNAYMSPSIGNLPILLLIQYSSLVLINAATDLHEAEEQQPTTTETTTTTARSVYLYKMECSVAK